MTIGSYLKKCREESGVTQKELTNVLFISTTHHIVQVESDQTTPHPEYLARWIEKIGAKKSVAFRLLMSAYRARVREGMGL